MKYVHKMAYFYWPILQNIQEALERLELPVNIAAGVARIELLGNRELYMDRPRGVLAYTTAVSYTHLMCIRDSHRTFFRAME